MSAQEAAAALAMMQHALTLGQFVTGDAPPPIVEDEGEAKLIFTGISHVIGVKDAALACNKTYREWEASLRPFIEAGRALREALALEKWGRSVIESKGRTPLERAAAWELTACYCIGDGNLALAADARAQARALLRGASVRAASTMQPARATA